MIRNWEDAAYAMPCLHQFCFQCIQRWANSKPECPLCRRRVHSIVHSVQADNDFEEVAIAPSASLASEYTLSCSSSLQHLMFFILC
uniref:RING-type E3 ubiquitin transferase n=1 Tax=Calidris pygmaea TaxID=425635 RepID=A0A8C3K312_9CHAR